MPSAVPDSNGPAGAPETFLVVKDLPFELRQYVSSYLQEQLYVPAFEVLQNVLISGADQVSGNQRRVFLPSSQVLALASTLIVYPPLTTRLPLGEKPVAADLALRYLRHLHTVLPLQPECNDAFIFPESDSERRNRLRRRNSLSENGVNSLSEFGSRLTTRVATDDSIFERAEDFWSVVGWAFNCSIKHIERWQRWRVWLDVMIGLLEQDLNMRQAEVEKRRTNDHDKISDHIFQDALLSSYVILRTQGRGEKKRIMRAILANGSKQSMNEFKEVWHNETKPPKDEKEEVDVDKLFKDEDGLMDESVLLEDQEYDKETSELAPGRSSRRVEASMQDGSDDEQEEVDETDLTHTIHDCGGSASLQLRQRVLGLLIRYSELYPSGFMGTREMLDIVADFMRPLPLHIFTHFVCPTKAYIDDPNAHCFLLLDLLCVIVGRQTPSHRKGFLQDQNELEKYYLPATASSASAIDNAKVSIMVEALMRLMLKEGHLAARPSLSTAVETGRKARLNRVRSDKKKQTEAMVQLTTQAVEVVENSSLRMAAMLDVINAKTG
ncbi:Hypothetical protein D9617_17g047090 [Elsinoe fawcettii]|nr:Hypothetical protein D9617_17g047090 [Elsinoe fawcettii]